MQIKHSFIQRMTRLFFTGFGMGAADIVPGVSGGTIAFIFGIYEELLASIQTVTSEVPRLILRGKVREAWNSIPFSFLIPLALGLGTAVLTLTSAISYLLETQPVFVWSFFFGLVLASIFLVSKRIVKWDGKDVFFLMLFTAVAYVLVGLVSFETATTPLAFVLAGAIAICAMILPGISGSFLLVIMGKYSQILAAVAERDFVTLGLVMIGIVLGLTLFSKLLSWLFQHYHDIVVASLTGFMIGSLRKIWPWKETITTRIDSHGFEVPLLQLNSLPQELNSEVLLAVALAIFAALFIIFLDKKALTKEHVEDLGSEQFAKEHAEALKNQ